MMLITTFPHAINLHSVIVVEIQDINLQTVLAFVQTRGLLFVLWACRFSFFMHWICLRSRRWRLGKAEIAPETQGSGETESVLEAWGVGRDGACARGQGGRARRSLRPRPKGRAFALLFFAAFYPPNLGIPSYGTQQLYIQIFML